MSLLASWSCGIDRLVKAMRLVQIEAHVCGCGVRGEEPEAEDSRRFQPPNLGEAVRDAGKCVQIPPPL